MKNFEIRPLSKSNHAWIANLLKERWASTKIVSRGKVHQADQLPGFIIVKNGKPVGLITYQIENNECEIITLDSLTEGIGIGSALVEKVKEVAIKNKCKRLWVITTNDNIRALKFYQNRGFKIKAIHKNAVEVSRKLKPEIPLIGIDGIPLRDEIELEINL